MRRWTGASTADSKTAAACGKCWKSEERVIGSNETRSPTGTWPGLKRLNYWRISVQFVPPLGSKRIWPLSSEQKVRWPLRPTGYGCRGNLVRVELVNVVHVLSGSRRW